MAQRLHYSIEYAHIYMDEQYNPEHAAAAQTVQRLRRQLRDAGMTTSQVVLIDDYNPDQHTLDPAKFRRRLEDAGAAPDAIAWESALVPYAAELLDHITKPRLGRDYRRYVEQKGKWPCSLLAATWYLLRLGEIPLRREQSVFGFVRRAAHNLAGDQLVNILPDRFAAVERQTLGIIGASTHAAALPRIATKYITSYVKGHTVDLVTAY